MKFKLYDEVRVVGSADPEGEVTVGHQGTIVDILLTAREYPYLVWFGDLVWRCREDELELA